MDAQLFEKAIAAFDARNAEDPVRVSVASVARPRALVEAERLSEWVLRLDASASVALRLAARCQHLERWTIPRESYPSGRVGYLTWRTELARFHARRAGEILSEVGYDAETVQAVQRINLKQNPRSSSDSQTMEDALCLVFLEHEFDAFLEKYPDQARAVEILRKTWSKMSERGHEAALALPLSPRARALVGRALSGAGG
jgi:hypothetical protein